jgi:hypothetical protein
MAENGDSSVPFEDVVNDQAYLKAGLMGLQGSGKTYTAAKMAIGLHDMLVTRSLADKDSPIWMCDTEVGSSWIRGEIAAAGKKFQADKTRSFKSLIQDCEQVASTNGVLIIDSITAYWRELCESYASKVGRRRLTFQDWGAIKSIWSEFTDLYVNGPFHCIMCGRQGYEYDFFEDDDGKKQLEKTGLKMKGEGETGYEPSLLVVMERHQQLGNNNQIEKVWRTAYVLKDRSTLIDGKSFENPTFADFMPHINCLNLGGEHVGVSTSQNSESMIVKEQLREHDETRRSVTLDEINELIKKHIPGMSADDKAARGDLLEKHAGTRSWKKVETFDLNELRRIHHKVSVELEKRPLYPELDDTTLLSGSPF